MISPKLISARMSLGLMAVSLMTSAFSQAPPRRARNLGQSLYDMVRPGESEIVVELTKDPPLMVMPAPGTSYRESMARAPAIFVILIREGRAALTRRDSWVQTAFTATVDRVLKNPLTARLPTGQSIDFAQDGGIVSIRGTKVEALIPWATPLKVGHRYLVFANVDPDGTAAFDATSMFELAATGVSPVKHLDFQNDIEGSAPDELLTSLATLVESQK